MDGELENNERSTMSFVSAATSASPYESPKSGSVPEALGPTFSELTKALQNLNGLLLNDFAWKQNPVKVIEVHPVAAVDVHPQLDCKAPDVHITNTCAAPDVHVTVPEAKTDLHITNTCAPSDLYPSFQLVMSVDRRPLWILVAIVGALLISQSISLGLIIWYFTAR